MTKVGLVDKRWFQSVKGGFVYGKRLGFSCKCGLCVMKCMCKIT